MTYTDPAGVVSFSEAALELLVEKGTNIAFLTTNWLHREAV